ncbi:hypothetical protein [Devosia marina]|nr:hypothetical protein [Devosia marina]
MRDRVLFEIAIDSKLCGRDLKKLKIGVLLTVMKLTTGRWSFTI